uniref:Uncharacterized protein n=1 Tax=Alexandrium monilatum TaxID=311494 RepID=A0A7S4WGI3_9DINO|mmetsp:Transcript_94407/g.281772  ORF Transcript_94407/g.281772 Transcript_94407/m.281772 type:complete len:316 (-) Transcript_94407:281-1228(-)
MWSAPKPQRRAPLCIWALAAALAWTCARPAWTFAAQAPSQQPRHMAATVARPQRRSAEALAAPWVRSAAVYERVSNPVKTVAETVADFYKAYPSPPVLPMYRTFLIDFMTQLHLVIVDSRFKYNAIFALGIKQYFSGLMGSYDKLVSSQQSEKIWQAMITSLGLEPDTVTADAEAVTAYASSTSPADILKAMEGATATAEGKVEQAFGCIGSSVYSLSFSVGLFKMMELSGVELSKDNVEEWAKALKITPSKVTNDLQTYKLNKDKLQKAEEMIREVEIREKKKLAERLEAKAKALAEKAAAKKANPPAEEASAN